MHLKRANTNKKYPIARKGTAYIVRADSKHEKALPLLIILRDLLKLGQTRAEVKKILDKGEVEVNGKIRKEEKFGVQLFDIINIKSCGKKYTLVLSESKKFKIAETKSENKISKIIDKKILPEGKIQINCNGGENFIVKDKINIGDSAVIDFKAKKIIKTISLKEGSKAAVIGGKYIGEECKVIKIEEEISEVEIKGSKVNISNKNLMAI